MLKESKQKRRNIHAWNLKLTIFNLTKAYSFFFLDLESFYLFLGVLINISKEVTVSLLLNAFKLD